MMTIKKARDRWTLNHVGIEFPFQQHISTFCPSNRVNTRPEANLVAVNDRKSEDQPIKWCLFSLWRARVEPIVSILSCRNEAHLRMGDALIGEHHGISKNTAADQFTLTT